MALNYFQLSCDRVSTRRVATRRISPASTFVICVSSFFLLSISAVVPLSISTDLLDDKLYSCFKPFRLLVSCFVSIPVGPIFQHAATCLSRRPYKSLGSPLASMANYTAIPSPQFPVFITCLSKDPLTAYVSMSLVA